MWRALAARLPHVKLPEERQQVTIVHYLFDPAPSSAQRSSSAKRLHRSSRTPGGVYPRPGRG